MNVEASAAPMDLSCTTEAAFHAVLRLVADRPGTMGRLRTARVVGGYSVPEREGDDPVDLGRYAIEHGWRLSDMVDHVDAMIAAGLIVQTPGSRPVLVLTRPGLRALDTMEAIAPANAVRE